MIIKAFAADSDKPSIVEWRCSASSDFSLAALTTTEAFLSLSVSLFPPFPLSRSIVYVHRPHRFNVIPLPGFNVRSNRRRLSVRQSMQMAVQAGSSSARRKRTNELGMCNFVVKYPGTSEFLACANYVRFDVSIARWRVSVRKPSSRRGQPFRIRTEPVFQFTNDVKDHQAFRASLVLWLGSLLAQRIMCSQFVPVSSVARCGRSRATEIPNASAGQSPLCSRRCSTDRWTRIEISDVRKLHAFTETRIYRLTDKQGWVKIY